MITSSRPPFWILVGRHLGSSPRHKRVKRASKRLLKPQDHAEIQVSIPGLRVRDRRRSRRARSISVHSTGTHTTTPTAPTASNPTAKIEKVRRPTISRAGSSEEWSYFLTRWYDYVEATKINGKDKVIQLLECCDEQLRKDLTRNAGGSLTNKTTDDVMAAIKKLAVRDENAMVARVQLHNIRQDRDETIRSFGARLRGQAGICKFLVTCPGCNMEVNYTENVDVVTRGLADDEIQLDLLGETNQDMTLEEVFQFIEAKESGKRSAGRLLQTHGADATRSQYRNAKQGDLRNRRTAEKHETCLYCGKQGHGHRATAKVRKQECSAYGHICQHCGRANHLEVTCQSKDRPLFRKPPNMNDTSRQAENAAFDALCSLSSSSENQSIHGISLDHHLYSHLNDRWIRRASQPQPFVTLAITIHPDDYIALGFKSVIHQPKSMHLRAMADTGCQSCLASMNIIRHLGLSEKDLIPVTTCMHAANNSGIPILGAAILRFSGKSKPGQHLETRQIVYVTTNYS